MKSLAALSLSLLAGCNLYFDNDKKPVNAEPEPPGSDPAPGSGSAAIDPRALFDATVAPLLSAKCAACHVGPETSTPAMFLGPAMTDDSFYTGIVTDRAINGDFDPSAAELLTKGVHEGPAWTSNEAAAIATWLEAEASARDTTPTDEPTAAEEQWASCLSISLADLTQTQANLIASMTSDDGRCDSCHDGGGAGGALFSADAQTMLTGWQSPVFMPAVFVPVGQGNGTFQMQVATAKLCAKGTELANDVGTHPGYDCNQMVQSVVPIQAMDTFRAAVQNKLDTNQCPPPVTF